MSNPSDTDVTEQRKKLAAAFDRDLDPLEQFESKLATADVDPFDMFVGEVIDPENPDERTRTNYISTFKQWKAYMVEQGRHPACPNEQHVKGFIHHLQADAGDGGRGNAVATVQQKLYRLNRVYEYWQAETPFPHPYDYNPIKAAREKVNLDTPDEKELPRIGLDEMRAILADVTHYRSRAIIAMQLKLGLRLGELCNIQLRDIHLSIRELRRHFPNMGTRPQLDGRENAIFIPSRDEYDGNKSRRPRVLPLDDELRRVLLRYLLIRPDNGKSNVFLTLKTHGEITDHATVNDVWKDAFHPEYDESEAHAAVTSHFGRHWFTTYWRVKQDVNDQLVKYMRGDRIGGRSIDEQSAMDTYLHAYYEDIEPIYRENIFKLGV